jgi:hypothetical protein
MKCKKINLQNRMEREKYSYKLKEFEKEFTYPLGNKQFYISHGRYSDYFDFFEQLGQPEFLILEDDDKIIGVVCLILRNINGIKSWYACDFKISKAYRGQKLYRKWMWKFFLPFYMKCQLLFGINMSNPENNKLWKHTQSIFKAFSIKVVPSYLYEFTAKEIGFLNDNILANYSLITNNGLKDIIIDGQSVSLYHLVEKNHLKNNLPHHKTIDVNTLKDSDAVMFLTPKKENISFAKESTITLIHRKNPVTYISSAEI